MTTQSVEKKRELIIVKRASGVALIMFDSAGKLNSLGSSTLVELAESLEVVQSDPSIKAVIGISGKHDSFVIGADLYEVKKSNFEQLLALSRRGQELFNQISCFNKPFIAAIHGACLGGGLEMAIASHARVASNSAKSIFGLPETRLGLVPGLGGTQRLPRLIGLKTAMDMILSATTISAEKAKEIGLLDELVDPDSLIEAAEKKALSLIDSPEWQELLRQNKEDCSGVKATKFCLVDLSQEKAEKLLSISERAVKIRTKGNYPAQTEAIAAVRTGLVNGLMAGLEYESKAFAELAAGEVSANLISLFFNTDLAKGSSQALVNKFPGSEVKTIGIVGAGTMGTSLSELAATHGIKVILKTSPEKLPEMNERVQQFAQREANQRAKTEGGRQDHSDYAAKRISVVSKMEELAEADMIIECTVEDPQIKKESIQKLTGIVSESCVIASNTSALSISDLSQSAFKPENFLGVHFFHPVDRMPLVELVPHAGTSKASLARATDLVLKLDKTPLAVKDKPGFLINRLLTVYLFELARLAEEKTPLNWIDDTMLEYGMPMGPLQLMDEIGIDVAFTVARNLEAGLGERLKSPEIFKRVCAIGMQGKRGNVGFYLWEGQEKRLGINPDMLEKTKAVVSAEKPDESEKARITDRMILTMLDEAARCLEERVVARPREVDFALILGVGFPAFRGGLLKYADHYGLGKAIEKLESIYALTAKAGSAGERVVSPLLKKYASEGRGFYSLGGSKED